MNKFIKLVNDIKKIDNDYEILIVKVEGNVWELAVMDGSETIADDIDYNIVEECMEGKSANISPNYDETHKGELLHIALEYNTNYIYPDVEDEEDEDEYEDEDEDDAEPGITSELIE